MAASENQASCSVAYEFGQNDERFPGRGYASCALSSNDQMMVQMEGGWEEGASRGREKQKGLAGPRSAVRIFDSLVPLLSCTCIVTLLQMSMFVSKTGVPYQPCCHLMSCDGFDRALAGKEAFQPSPAEHSQDAHRSHLVTHTASAL